ncbi:MAG: beta-N-acetylhexosaminidase [Desulfobacterales bacterium]|nr:beta-N-acetylhexosaminidase [Desulfobacterales bacterium]
MDVESLSAEQAAGQRLMVGFEGTELSQTLKFYIDTLKVGGVILFTQNIDSPGQITQLCQSIQEYARRSGQPSLFVAIDQEGGTVARLKTPFTQFAGNPAMEGVDDAAEFGRVTAAELAAIGVNMNLAPVLDVVPEGFGGIMAERVFGPDPDWVSELGLTVISHLQQRNIMAVAKHFPGIGRTTLDSHGDRPVLDAEFNDLNRFDLVPFKNAVANHVAGMMLSHVVYTRIDDAWPASLSVEIAKNLLRKRLGFEGVILTDDLDMGAIVKYYDIHTVMERIIAAGIDITLICHEGPRIETAFEILLKGYADKTIDAREGTEAVRRILKLKRKYLAAV